MKTFKVGDIVKGINGGRYEITNDSMKEGKIIKVHDDGLIDIKILEHTYKCHEGSIFTDLLPRYFELVKGNIGENSFLPKHYIINKNATILIWEDGTKTVVKRCEDDEFNPRLGFLTAMFQHYCGMTKNKANKYLANLQVEDEKEDTNKEEK